MRTSEEPVVNGLDTDTSIVLVVLVRREPECASAKARAVAVSPHARGHGGVCSRGVALVSWSDMARQTSGLVVIVLPWNHMCLRVSVTLAPPEYNLNGRGFPLSPNLGTFGRCYKYSNHLCTKLSPRDTHIIDTDNRSIHQPSKPARLQRRRYSYVVNTLDRGSWLACPALCRLLGLSLGTRAVH